MYLVYKSGYHKKTMPDLPIEDLFLIRRMLIAEIERLRPIMMRTEDNMNRWFDMAERCERVEKEIKEKLMA